MKTWIKVLYYLTLSISALVGLWHFFVPKMFGWYDYLSMEYKNLIVGIDWTNYCFSMFLFGISLLLLILGKRVLSLKSDAIYFLLLFNFYMGIQGDPGDFYRAMALAANSHRRHRAIMCIGYNFRNDADY